MAVSDDEKQSDIDTNPLCLDETELKCLASQAELPESNSGYTNIYRHATTMDFVVMFLSAVAAVGAGAAMPLMMLVMGSLVGNFADFSDNSLQSFSGGVDHLVLYFVYIGVANLALTSLFVFGFSWTGERITKRLRALYFEALLRQNMAFLDSVGAGEAATRITVDLNLVQDGVSQKVGLTIVGFSGFVAALVISFIRSWRLALVMLSVPFVITTWMIVVGTKMKMAQQLSTNLYSNAATFAEEAISSTRNVAAYGLQKHFVSRYGDSLVPAAKADFHAKGTMGVFIGGMMWMMLSSFALAGWAGSRFMEAGDINIAEIVTVLFTSAIAGVSFGNIAPHLQAFGAAAAAANRILAAVQRQPPAGLETNHGTGKRIDQLQGNIHFEDVKLVYPSRTSQLIMEHLTLDIPAGKTTAIVGPSGTGKSSIMYLLQRFYMPLGGQILVDGHDLKDLDLHWLRSKMKIVNQDPFLFSGTIFDNIALGLVGTDMEHADTATKTKFVEQAATAANAHEFICQLPRAYDTLVGENGGQLSGGQRQRIAIARALVSDPSILLLDEATAALDTKSESLVQQFLNTSPHRRTTIVIAHRLSTIRHADKIVVMEHGHIVEQGTHSELLAKKGTYASLVEVQNLQSHETTSKGAGQDANHEKTIAYDPVSSQAKSVINEQQTNRTLKSSSTTELVRFLLKLNHPERTAMLLGMIGCVFSGIAHPITAILFGNMVIALQDPSQTLGGYGVNFWAGMQWLTAWVVFFGYVLQGVPLAWASSRLIARARSKALGAILRQDSVFFTRPGNSSGALTAFLAKQANSLNGLSGTILGALLNSTFAVVAGFAVAVGFGWKLGLVAAATMPVIVVTGYARYRILTDLEKRNLRDTQASGVVSESIRGIRTIAAFSLEENMVAKYREQLGRDFRTGVAKNLLLAVLYGASQSIITLSSALIFWYGGSKLLPTGEYSVQNFLICYVATTYTASSAGGIFSFAPDVAGAQDAAEKLKALLETVPQIDVEAETGMPADGVVGNVELHDVDFAYPSSEGGEHPVLRHISLRATFGRFVALVGASGSGKSTVLNLLERLYDTKAGEVRIDGHNIRDYNLQHYRSQLAIVEQDAVLYSGTIRENVMAGSAADDDRIERSCRDANIWEFVSSLPEGLSTMVGPRGSQVSGGQKQRLALARALLRDPKVLLLDEATSALDSQSEAVVQKALVSAAVGRTTIAVAHRLSSISHADCIYVFDNGVIIEHGTHGELMAAKGRYWEYVGMQSLSQ